MNEVCPCCGLLFQREEGYFLGAMYFSYGISSVILAVFYFTLLALLPDGDTLLLPLGAVLLYLPFMPAVFRYSRVLWIYFDRAADPNGALAGTYEKRRLEQLGKTFSRPPAAGADVKPSATSSAEPRRYHGT